MLYWLLPVNTGMHAIAKIYYVVHQS